LPFAGWRRVPRFGFARLRKRRYQAAAAPKNAPVSGERRNEIATVSASSFGVGVAGVPDGVGLGWALPAALGAGEPLGAGLAIALADVAGEALEPGLADATGEGLAPGAPRPPPRVPVEDAATRIARHTAPTRPAIAPVR
jgi:hypothetical protein